MPEERTSKGGSKNQPDRKRKTRGKAALGPTLSLFKRWEKTVLIAYKAEEVLPEIGRLRPKGLSANPSYLRLLAEAMEDMGVEDIRPKAVMTGGQVLDEPTRDFLESSFGCGVYDCYAFWENPSLTWECERKEGYHIDADHMILETVREGQQVSPGEEGEIVVTGLLNYAMPLIKYRSGDIGVLGEDLCSCGRGLPLMDRVEGRAIDCLVPQNGRRVTSKTIMAAVQRVPGVTRYQVVQESRNKVTIQIMKREKDPDISFEELVESCRGVLGKDVEIEVFVGGRENVQAKFRPVISKLTVDKDARWTQPRHPRTMPSQNA